MTTVSQKHDGQSGQAAVESALTLPLTVFLVLGTLQLFLMLQARMMAQYAAFKAVRAGAVNHGDCRVMTDAALAALLPTFARTDDAGRLTAAFAARSFARGYRYTGSGEDTGHDRQIFWLDRQQVTVTGPEEKDFDQWDSNGPAGPTTLEARLVFWFPLKVPFADWVMSRMFLALFGLQPYAAQNPLMPTATARQQWQDVSSSTLDSQMRVKTEFSQRVSQRQFEFPITVNYAMRMMTPARAPFPTECPPRS